MKGVEYFIFLFAVVAIFTIVHVKEKRRGIWINCAVINTLNIMNRDSGSTIAARRAQAYRGGNLSDWYLPNVAETNALCRWAKFLTPAFTDCTGGGIDSSSRAQSIGINGDYWTSSEGIFAAAVFHIRNESFVENNQGKNQSYKIRPIRAF